MLFARKIVAVPLLVVALIFLLPALWIRFGMKTGNDMLEAFKDGVYHYKKY
jgi:hypothetical protein